MVDTISAIRTFMTLWLSRELVIKRRSDFLQLPHRLQPYRFRWPAGHCGPKNGGCKTRIQVPLSGAPVRNPSLREAEAEVARRDHRGLDVLVGGYPS
jgi:hypothetical protein